MRRDGRHGSVGRWGRERTRPRPERAPKPLNLASCPISDMRAPGGRPLATLLQVVAHSLDAGKAAKSAGSGRLTEAPAPLRRAVLSPIAPRPARPARRPPPRAERPRDARSRARPARSRAPRSRRRKLGTRARRGQRSPSTRGPRTRRTTRAPRLAPAVRARRPTRSLRTLDTPSSSCGFFASHRASNDIVTVVLMGGARRGQRAPRAHPTPSAIK
jgi:hypothetical protein